LKIGPITKALVACLRISIFLFFLWFNLTKGIVNITNNWMFLFIDEDQE
tara:strand:- start:103 stop:249 length:147 start_codon:yes stop_codon:yes gene_type:complete